MESNKLGRRLEVTSQLLNPRAESLLVIMARLLFSAVFCLQTHIIIQNHKVIFINISAKVSEHQCSTPVSVSICLAKDSCKLRGLSPLQRWTFPPAPQGLSIIPPSQSTLVEMPRCPLRLQHFDTIF